MDNIPHEIVNGLKVITRETLARICPEAYACKQTDNVGGLDEEDLDYIWIMGAKPVLLTPDIGEDDDERQEWSETNEPELAAWVAEEWDDIAVTLPDGNKVLILCGSLDDECGNFWRHNNKVWTNYCF